MELDGLHSHKTVTCSDYIDAGDKSNDGVHPNDKNLMQSYLKSQGCRMATSDIQASLKSPQITFVFSCCCLLRTQLNILVEHYGKFKKNVSQL